MKTLLFGALLVMGLSCGISNNDPSMDLTGTESEPLASANGTLSCPASKDLICHYPPGNHANAHSICVGPPAWPPHRDQHGDTLGACGAATTGGGNGGADAGTGGTGGSGGGDAGTGRTGGPGGGACGTTGAACSASTPCCTGLLCNSGVCSQSGQ
jgi:hypothetical protein